MGVGVPVLRTRTSGTSELIVENVAGRSTPIEHDAFVAAAIEFGWNVKIKTSQNARLRHREQI